MSLCCLLVWLNLLALMLPFRKFGQLLLSLWCMLMNDILCWILVAFVFLGAFSIATYAALIMSNKFVTDVLGATTNTRQMTLASMFLKFSYISAGEVVPGDIALLGRNGDLINVYNLAFVLLVTVLLVNLLIALMGSTFTHHSQSGCEIWWVEFADLVLQYEKRLSAAQRTKYRSGESVGDTTDPDSCKFFFVDIALRGNAAAGLPHSCDASPEDDDTDQANPLQTQVDQLAAGLAAVEKAVAALTDHLQNQAAPLTPENIGSASLTTGAAGVSPLRGP